MTSYPRHNQRNCQGVPARHLQLLRLRSQRPHLSSSGMITLSFGLIMLVLAGSAAIVASGLSWQSASSRGGDAEQAREAAEEGYNRLIDLLNDPGNSYLLVTKRENWTINTVNAPERQTCNISSSTTGAISPASIIETPTPFPSVGNGRQVRYTLESFTPPQYPGAEPSGCTKFWNLAGGTARLVIRGDVLRNGSVIASHRIERAVTVEAAVETTGASATSPTLGILATGSGGAGTDLKPGSNFYYDTASAQWKGQSNDTRIPITCLADCTGLQSPSSYSRQAISTADFLTNFPARPPYNAADLDALSSGEIRSDNAASWAHFPYSSNDYTALLPYCRRTSITSTIGSASNSERVIACKVSRLDPGTKNWTIYTDKSSDPVVVYLVGNSNEFKISEGRNIINERFRLNRSTEPLSWSQLRIFGDPSTAASSSFTISAGMTSNNLNKCLNNNKQILKFNEKSRVNGAFIWVPKGEFTFEGAAEDRDSSLYSIFGVLWGCKIEAKSGFGLLLNKNTTDISAGIDQVFARTSPTRFIARGSERVLQ